MILKFFGKYFWRRGFIFLFLPFLCWSQEKRIDSLKEVIRTSRVDSAVTKSWMKLCFIYTRKNQYDDALKAAGEALKLAVKNKDNKKTEWIYTHLAINYRRKGDLKTALVLQNKALAIALAQGWKDQVGNAYNSLGNIYSAMGNFPESLKYYNEACKIKKEAGAKDLAGVYNNLGLVFWNMGDLAKALDYFYLVLKLDTEKKDFSMMGADHNNLGLVYQDKGDYERAIHEYSLALRLRDSAGDKSGYAQSLGNIGLVQKTLGRFNESLQSLTKALEIRKELGEKGNVANSFGSLGSYYAALYEKTNSDQDLKIAENYYREALAIQKEIGDKKGVCVLLGSLGNVYTDMKKYPLSREYIQQSLIMSGDLGMSVTTKNNYWSLYQLDSIAGDSKSAYQNFMKYYSLRDSLNSEEATKKMVKASLNYEFEQREMQDKILSEQKLALSEKEKRRELLLRNAVIGGLLLFVLLFAVFLRAYVNKRKANKVIREQKKEVEEATQVIEIQKLILEEKQKELMDSINCARKIQMSLLPSSHYMVRKMKSLREK